MFFTKKGVVCSVESFNRARGFKWKCFSLKALGNLLVSAWHNIYIISFKFADCIFLVDCITD